VLRQERGKKEPQMVIEKKFKTTGFHRLARILKLENPGRVLG
jgi:hypothetical protein